MKGNLAIERHPDYKCLLLEYFQNLKELDSQSLAKLPGKEQGVKLQIKAARSLKREIIPFLFRMDKILKAVEDKIDAIKAECSDRL